MKRIHLTSLTLLIMALVTGSATSSAEENPILWKKHVVQARNDAGSQVNTVVAEDFDRDGAVDIMASFDGKVVLYRGPKWEKTVVLPAMPADKTGRNAKRGCIHSTLMDVDGDGDLDYVGSNRMLFWLECPKDPFAGRWVFRIINLELNGAHCVITGDVDRDGQLDLIANSWRDKGASSIPNSITWLQVPKQPRQGKIWRPFVFADADAPGANHYMGFGDVNQDGRADIACGAKGGSTIPGGAWFAWWEQPTDPKKAWKKHLLSANEPGASNILPLDLNADGHVDFLASRGHGKGVLWFRGPEFTKIEIDASLDTPHSLAAADIDADGDIDFATCSSELGGMTAWYENGGKANFTRHVLDRNQSSYDLRLVDLDSDGDLDILIAGHHSHNIVWYENTRK
ncbi:MAG: hypothetical protein ACI814_004188 [Mariniblastus sp.]|jgi:hypothetical protein